MQDRVSRRGTVAAFIAMDILSEANRLAREGRSILHMELGEPAAPVPGAVRRAAEVALAAGRVGYTEALGRPGLRQRIARHYADRHGLSIDPARIAVTAGSSAAFNLAFLALFDAGDRIGMPAPGYPAYRNILAALGLEVVEIETDAASGWQVTPALVERARAGGPLAGLIVASPANPTGAMMDAPALAALVEACRAGGTRLVMDEIYHGLSWTVPETSALSFGEDVVVVNSFSKYWCMTGWRIGWMVMPEALVRPVERLAQNLYISPPALSQDAAIAAFEATDELDRVKEGYARARALLLDGLPRIGLAGVVPIDGAFYAYVDLSALTSDSLGFARALLRQTGVAATPGLDFDPVRGGRTLRLSFAGGPEVTAAALARMADFLAGQRR